jgi:glycosyltransferase involved in cell wall biosynthesis
MSADRITIIVAALAGGGAERVVVDLARYLGSAGRTVTVLTLNRDVPDDYALSPGVGRERADVGYSAATLFERIRNSIASLLALRRKILSVRPDVVISFVDQTNVRIILSLLGSRLPVIVSERVHPDHNLLTPFWRMLRRMTYPLATAVTVQTEDGANWFRRFTRVKGAVVIPNATRFRDDVQAGDSAAARAAPRPLIVAMGRLTAQKGFDLLLDAFSRSGLPAQGWHLAILGEGPESKVLAGQVTALELTGSVSFPGHVRDVGSWLRSADMFVLSSRFEGFPNALVEAMQVGAPVISFDCESGPRELIRHGVNGCLVQPEDVAALADQMRLLGIDPELRARLGAEAAGVNETLSPEKIYVRWLGLIDAVASGEFDARRKNALLATPQDAGESRLRGQRGAGS